MTTARKNYKGFRIEYTVKPSCVVHSIGSQVLNANFRAVSLAKKAIDAYRDLEFHPSAYNDMIMRNSHDQQQGMNFYRSTEEHILTIEKAIASVNDAELKQHMQKMLEQYRVQAACIMAHLRDLNKENKFFVMLRPRVMDSGKK